MIPWDIVAVVTVFASVFLFAACAMWNYGNKQHTDRAPHRESLSQRIADAPNRMRVD